MKRKPKKPDRVIPVEVFCIDEEPVYFTAYEERRLADPTISEAERRAIIEAPRKPH